MSEGRDPKTGQFVKGNSGNPGGQALGARRRLTGDFLRTLADDFAKHGAKAIEQCRKEKPEAYVRAIAALCPKEIEVSRPLQEMDDAELLDAVRALESYLAARPASQGAGDPSEPPKAH